MNLAERHDNRLLIDRIDTLRPAFAHVKSKYSFEIAAAVILPDHLHCIWTLPDGDDFSRHLEKGERISRSRKKRGERGLWQRRFWEHLIRDEADYRQHIDYIHWNPVKHGYVKCVKEWPYSSFHNYVAHGIYPESWGDAVALFPVMAGE